MLICLGGFLGSGRRILARRLSTRLKFYYYDTESKKLHRHTFNKSGHVREETQHSTTDKEQLFIYEKILKDFPLISKMHRDVVIDDSFHRAKPREYFLVEARKYFDTIVFVWIDSDEEHVANRFRLMQITGMTNGIRGALQRREREQKEFEPFESSPLTFHHALSNDKAAGRLIELIRTEAPEITDTAKILA